MLSLIPPTPLLSTSCSLSPFYAILQPFFFLPLSPPDLIFLIYYLHVSLFTPLLRPFLSSLPFTSSLASLRHHVILSRAHYHQSMAEVLTQQLWLQLSILQCWSTQLRTHAEAPGRSLPPRLLYPSERRCVRHYIDMLPVLGAFLQRHGDQKKLIWLNWCCRLRQSDGWADYNALQHVSNMPATHWAAILNPPLDQTPMSNLIIRESASTSPSHRKGPLGLERQG